ncbi:GAF and ANTAR domain-containing protein [Mycobacterium sp. 1423905.2]|uniref:GAF and ANTAR domain-containing protein n=1 Tax=Mycobacterium sp. 1423905.2 TaxID=1856859 RepID=UPI0008005752|nr:GAF and ANTAR domain-containing protein [Mycobacterium sp. 1423905.2]OBJ56423.1 histidine kinase [Mycobacterium sp. 1423905.2]
MDDPDRKHDLAKHMAELARSMAAPRAVNDILAEVTNAAVDLIPAVDVAGVLLVKKGGEFESLADTDGVVAKLDKLQHDFGEGPCAEAALSETVVRSNDMRTEGRWPRYAPAAADLGILSSLSFKLYTADRTAGALNLFSTRNNAWDVEAETIGAVLAAHAAAAILAGRHSEQMQSALASRDRIGQAKGIIMERYSVDEVRAFEMLRVLSQENQTKLVDIAQRVIDTAARAPESPSSAR